MKLTFFSHLRVFYLICVGFFLLGAPGKATRCEESSHPLREVAIISAPEGLYPATVVAFKGEKLRFFMTSAKKEGTSCLSWPEKKLFLGAGAGEVSSGQVILDQAGSFTLDCPSAGEHKLNLVVIDKSSHRKRSSMKGGEENGKGPLSQWRPRER